MSSYSFTQDEEMYYDFTSDKGYDYTIWFDVDQGNSFVSTTSFPEYQGQIYWMVIECSEESPEYDHKVGNTTRLIVESWFQQYGKILYYVCSDKDGKGINRHHKFVRWAKRKPDEIRFDPIEADFGETQTYSGLMLPTNTEWYSSYCENFDIFKQEILADPDKPLTFSSEIANEKRLSKKGGLFFYAAIFRFIFLTSFSSDGFL